MVDEMKRWDDGSDLGGRAVVHLVKGQWFDPCVRIFGQPAETQLAPDGFSIEKCGLWQTQTNTKQLNQPSGHDKC